MLEVRTIIDAVRAMPLKDRLMVVEAISIELDKKDTELDGLSDSFWSPKSIDELSAIRPGPVVADIRTLAAHFWPQDETADDINRFVAEQRRADRAMGA